MNNRKFSGESLKFNLDTGRLTLDLRDEHLLGQRGLHVFIKTDAGVAFSTEATAIDYSNKRSSMHTKHAFLPIEFFWKNTFQQDKLNLSIHAELKQKLYIEEISISLPLNALYNIFSVEGSKRSIFSFKEIVISGMPRYRCITMESSSGALPPLRIMLDPEVPINRTSIGAQSFDPLKPFVKFTVLKSWKDSIELDTGKLLLFKAAFFFKRAYPNPFCYPPDIFAERPLRSILVVSSLNPSEAIQLADSVRNVLPVVQQHGNKVSSPEITFCSYKKTQNISISNPEFEIPTNPWEIIRFSRKVSRKIKPDITIHVQKDINLSTGFQFTLLSFLLRVNFKVKMDQSGESVFMLNSLRGFFKRRIVILKSKLKIALKFFSNVFLLICWIIAISIFFGKELLKRLPIPGKA